MRFDLYIGTKPHNRSVIAGMFFAVLLPMLHQDVRGDDLSKSSLRDVVRKSLPFIEKEGFAWIEEKKCLSCHQVPSMVWSLNRAQEAGFELDAKQMKTLNRWSTEWINLLDPDDQDGAEETETLLNENDAIAALLLGLTRQGESGRPGWVEQYRDHLIQAQQKDGTWIPKGQLPKQKRPFQETTQVSTMWALLAISSYVDSATPPSEWTSAVDKAMPLISKTDKGISTEWWATKLMLSRQLGKHEQANQVKTSILDHQNDDGGWGWLTDDKSDALGTGLALYALARDGMTMSDPQLANALRFLQSTQNDDGSWSVDGTKTETKDGATPTSSFWGTSWAVIGILESLESNGKPKSAYEIES